jgi:glycosyltransferase involved in cell wall biosynthesis
VSEACEHFVRDTFAVKNIRTIYRWIESIAPETTRSTNEIHIGFVGRLVDLKWVDVLLSAFRDFLYEYTGEKSVKLYIVWDGPERKRLEHIQSELWLNESVSFLGKKTSEEVRTEILPSWHIFVNPSFQEGFPTTPIEALLAGCQVIATDVWGTREILRYIPFTLVAPRNSRALSDALSESIDHLQDESHPISDDIFTWNQTFREFREVYNQFSL